MKNYFLIFLLLTTVLTGKSFATPLEGANAAYKSGDYKTAFKLFSSLAENGDQMAQSYLGAMYYHGEGVSKNYPEAFNWFKKAAEQGDMLSERNLASMYYYGEGTPQNYLEAFKWFKKAAEQGDDASQHSLGQMYKGGNGVPQNHIIAHMWFNLAASKDGISSFAKDRNELATMMTSEQIAAAQRMASEWKKK